MFSKNNNKNPQKIKHIIDHQTNLRQKLANEVGNNSLKFLLLQMLLTNLHQEKTNNRYLVALLPLCWIYPNFLSKNFLKQTKNNEIDYFPKHQQQFVSQYHEL